MTGEVIGVLYSLVCFTEIPLLSSCCFKFFFLLLFCLVSFVCFFLGLPVTIGVEYPRVFLFLKLSPSVRCWCSLCLVVYTGKRATMTS